MSDNGNLLLRNDTFLGVCEGLGEDFGFNANWLRIALGVAFFFSPLGVIAGYLAVGLIVAAARLIYPNRSPNAVSDGDLEASQISAQDDELPLAA